MRQAQHLRQTQPIRRTQPMRRTGSGEAVWGLRLAVIAGLVALFTVVAHATTPNSDAASLILEGQSVGRGAVLLPGWALSLDSFWSVEVPFYAVSYLVLGVHPLLLSLVPAVIATLVVVSGVLIAGDGRSGAAAIAGTVTVAALLVLAPYAFSRFFLQGGDHIGALLFTLVAFFAVRRGRWGPGVVVAVILLAAGMLGDLETAAYGTAPLFLAGVAATLRRRSVRDGLPALFTAAAATVLALVVRRAVQAAGAFTMGRANKLADRSQVERNIKHLPGLDAELFGAHSSIFGTGGTPGPLQDVHIVGALVVVICFVLALIRLGTGAIAGGPGEGSGPIGGPSRWWRSDVSWRLDDMLVFACLGSTVSYLFMANIDSSVFTRYLTASVVFMIALSGRVVARAWPSPHRRALVRGLAVTATAVLVCFAVGFGYLMSAPARSQPAAPLASWLEKHHLTNGVGAYWSATITTVQSRDDVKVRPVISNQDGRLVRYSRESAAAWYSGQEFQFLVLQPREPWGGVDMAAAVRTFGRPARSYRVRSYQVLVWAHPFTVAPTGGTD